MKIKIFNFAKDKWRNLVIIGLLVVLLGTFAIPATADVIKIRPVPALDDLTDVNATSPNNNDVLTWDTGLSEWINAAQAAVGANRTGRTVTYVVAASDAPSNVTAQADYVCDGIDDHIEIQAAIDALPATGGEIRLSSGTFSIEASLVLDSNQTLRGCGRNTILTTHTGIDGLITAIGGEATEKQGIIITDLEIDAASIAYSGIYWQYVDYSTIGDCWIYNVIDSSPAVRLGAIQLLSCDYDRLVNNGCFDNDIGICLGDNTISWAEYCTNVLIENNMCQENTIGIYVCGSYNTIVSNICQGNDNRGIHGEITNVIIKGNTCYGNGDTGIVAQGNAILIEGNICKENGSAGIEIEMDNNIIEGNICQGNTYHGIEIDWGNNILVEGNTCYENGWYGIWIESSNDLVENNVCFANSQAANNTYDNIYILPHSDSNFIISNVCRQGELANKPRYGINIVDATCDQNIIYGNSLGNSGATGDLNDLGTDTIYVGLPDMADAIARVHDRLHSLTSVDHSDVNITSPADNDIIYWDNATGKWMSKAGGGDMLKSTYDTNNDGVVDTAEALAALATKNPPVNNDTVVQRDSTNFDSLFTSTWTQIKAFLQSFFDGVYASLADFLGLNSTVDALNTTVAGHIIDIANLQGNVSAIQGDIVTLQADISTLNSTIAVLNSTVEGHTVDIATLQGNVSALQGDVSTLQADFATLNSTVSSLNSTVSVLVGDVSDLQGDVSDLQGDVSDLQTDVSNLQGNMTALQGTVSGHTIDISNLQGNMTIAQGNITTLSGSLTSLNTTVINNSGNITGLKSIGIVYVIDGGGSAITTGQKGHLSIPFDCTITGWTLLADQSGNITIDVWKDTYANFPPTVADNITGTEKPTLTSVQKNQDTNLTTWATSVTSGDILAFNVDSCATITRVTLTITATRVI